MNSMVSIIMPVYNADVFIKSAIESVLQQTYPEWELIIVDDHSTDRSESIIMSYTDSRMVYIRNQTRLGVAKSRNLGIRHSQGRYIAFLDSDDYWDPNKLAVQIDHMQNEEHPFSFTHYKIVYVNSAITRDFQPGKNVAYHDVLKVNNIGCSTVVYEKHHFETCYFPENKDIREDMAMWLIMLKHIDYAQCIPKCLSYYRVQHKSASSNKFRMIAHQYNTYRYIAKLRFPKIAYYMTLWAINGLLKRVKYRIIQT